MAGRLLLLAGWLLLATGCAWHTPGSAGLGHHGPPVWLENPLLVPAADREVLWNQLVDTLDDYFKIEREERVRQVGNVLTEGRIETFPETGATWLEPWRRDSTKGPERRYATFQSVRRRAIARVWPAEGGYRVEVMVFRELEDLERPEYAPVGGVVYRHDGTLVRTEDRYDGRPATLGWIAQGRDMSLEQQILAEFRGRMTGL